MPHDLQPLAVPEIVAGAYQLRPLEPSDAAELLTYLAQPSIRQNFGGEPPTTADEMDSWIERRLQRPASATGLSWTIRSAVGGTLVGTIECHGLDLEGSVGELGYGVHDAHRRQGVASTAVRAVTSYLHSALTLHRVQLMHSVGNEASCAVAVACAFTYEGTLRGTGRDGGVFIDEHMHSHLDGEPLTRQN